MKYFIIFFPIILIVALFGGYFAWWSYAAAQMKDVTQIWVDDMRSQGYQVHHGKPEFSGFPIKLAMNLSKPFIMTPDASISYKGANLLVESLPWNPTKYRLNIIGTQTINVNKPSFSDVFNVTATDTFAVVKIKLNGKLKGLDFTSKNLKIIATNFDDAIAIDDLSAAVTLPEKPARTGEDKALTVHLNANNIHLPKKFQSPLKPFIKYLSTRFDIYAPLTNAAPQQALEKWQMVGGKIDIMDFSLNWDNLIIGAHGEASLDDGLYPRLDFDAEIAGLENMIMALAENGLINSQMAKLSAIGVQLMAKKPEDGGPAMINIAISAQDGFLYLGPLQVAELPNIIGEFKRYIPDRAAPAPVGQVEIETTLPKLTEPPTVSFKPSSD